MTISRFAFVKYDAKAAESQNALRAMCKQTEDEIEAHQPEQNTPQGLENLYLHVANTAIEGPYKQAATTSLLMTIDWVKTGDKQKALIELEAAYFWAGKFIRLAQIERNA